MINKIFPDDTPRYVKVITVGIAAFVLIFYIQYLFSAWFYQDDFAFLYRYGFKNSLHMDQVLTFGNFGRFLSINIFYFLAYKFIGTNAQMYFAFNLFIIIASAFFLHRFIMNILGEKGLAVFSAFTYLIMAPTVRNMVWVSNMQHLLSHLFIFIFLSIYFNKDNTEKLATGNSIVLFALFFCALNSHIISIITMPILILYHILFRKNNKLSVQKVILISSCTLVSAIYAIMLARYTSSGYSTNLSVISLVQTLLSYSKGLYGNFIIFIILFTLIIATSIVKKDVMIIFLLAISILFYSMPGILDVMIFINYVALSYVFFIITLLYVVHKYFHKHALVLAVLVFVFIISIPKIQLYADRPLGPPIKKFISDVKYIYQKEKLNSYGRVCFKYNDLNRKADSDTGQIDEKHRALRDFLSVPIFWHQLLNGESLKIFIDDSINYQLYEEEPCEKCPVIEVTGQLRSFYEDMVIERVVVPKLMK